MNRRLDGAMGLVAALLVTSVAVAPARAGEQLTVTELVARSQAVLEVSVTFEGTRALRVDAQRWLWRDSQAPALLPRAGNLCLPTRERLRQWRTTYRDFPRPTRARWAQLARAKGYRAVTFLRQRGSRLVPYCELEALALVHVASHPDFAGWRLLLQRALAAPLAPGSGAVRPR